MKHLISTAAILVSVTLASHTMAAPQNYKCEILSKTNDGFIPPVTLLSLDTTTNQMEVYDGYIKEMQNNAIVTDATLISKGKYRIKYRVEIQTTNSGKLALTYSLRFDQGRLGYTLNGVLHGSDNRISGAGTCRPIT
jgi:hypothetical protein